MAVSGTRGPAFSDSGLCRCGTLGEIEKFKMAAKMAAANVNTSSAVAEMGDPLVT